MVIVRELHKKNLMEIAKNQRKEELIETLEWFSQPSIVVNETKKLIRLLGLHKKKWVLSDFVELDDDNIILDEIANAMTLSKDVLISKLKSNDFETHFITAVLRDKIYKLINQVKGVKIPLLEIHKLKLDESKEKFRDLWQNPTPDKIGRFVATWNLDLDNGLIECNDINPTIGEVFTSSKEFSDLLKSLQYLVVIPSIETTLNRLLNRDKQSLFIVRLFLDTK
jgi:hypothetical protein